MIPIQSEIFLLSDVKQENLANLLQRELGTFGVTNVRGKRIDADRRTVHRAVAQAIADYNIIMIIGGMGEKHANMTVQAVSAAIGFDTVEKDGELFPEGAEIFKSKEGYPSGCAIAIMSGFSTFTFRWWNLERSTAPISRLISGDFIGKLLSLRFASTLKVLT